MLAEATTYLDEKTFYAIRKGILPPDAPPIIEWHLKRAPDVLWHFNYEPPLRVLPKKSPLKDIREALKTSRALLELENDWDGEGSEGYALGTWKRMAGFLLTHALEAFRRYGVITPKPSILPGPDGSIDILWRNNDYEFLLNIPPNHDEKASFYGDDRGSISIKGTLDTSKINCGFLLWLTTHKPK